MITRLAGLARPMLLLMEPERAHETTLRALESGLFSAPAEPDDPRLAVDIWGHRLPNPIGIAAGFDKNGRVPDVLVRIGFGFAEIGTVTPLPQVGNPKPRVFRLIRDRALINRLGFNNAGHIRVKARLAMRERNGVMGVNVGANKDSADRTADYVQGIETFYDDADYFMVNISSPNTKNLRELQGEDELNRLLARISERRSALSDQHGRRVPVAVKVAPDLEEAALPVVADVIVQHGMDAVIATNTTLSRDGVQGLKHAEEAGGLSGAPLKPMADKVLAAFRSNLPGKIALIGVGGITCGQDAVDKLDLGADLVQFYTGMVYRGPELVNECLRAIAKRKSA